MESEKINTAQPNLQEFRKFLTENFNGLSLRNPLFYNWDIGIRFNLQVGKTNTDEYFEIVNTRATQIFEMAFRPTSNMYLVLMDFKYKRRKIRFSNYAFQQIPHLNRSNILYAKKKGLREPNDPLDIWNLAIIKTNPQHINYVNIFRAIGHTDFPSRKPRLDHRGFLSAKELFFVNIDKKLIFHLYDDRGLDLIASHLDPLKPIYEKHRDWILDYDQQRIHQLFL